MAIQPSYISSQPISENTDTTISLLTFRPTGETIIDPPLDPGLLVGYYNGSLDSVELFIVSGDGTRYIKAL